MPAPQASAMQQLARLKFTSFNLKVPQNWQEPSGDPAAKHYGDAFKPEEKATAPAGMPPLFQPASLNKYHTDTQKMHIAKIGAFIDGTCSAICWAWSQWQTACDDGRHRDHAAGRDRRPDRRPAVDAADPGERRRSRRRWR